MSNTTQQLKAQQRRQRFADLLRAMFQLNQPELDFGLYRIMHARKNDINRFIEKDLPRITQDAFASFANADKTQIEQALEKAINGAKALEVDPDSLPKVQELKAKLADNFDLAREEGEVYDALVTFFNRYYSEGDFLSRRVYKDGTYAIPYQGEEVVLHWANKDQYYIKSSETLRDYSFRLNPDAPADENPQRVHFKLVDAEAGAKDNNKEGDDNKRVFILDSDTPYELIDGDSNENGESFPELQLRFYFRSASNDDWTEAAQKSATPAAKKKPPTQDHLRAIAVNSLLGAESALPDEWKELLAQPYKKADGDLADYSMLQGQMNNYTKKNSFDYFIHKDLSGFLTRELDFYIKNELLDWSDIATLKNDTARLAPLLSKIEVIRTLGEKIVAFLAQLENFQKKLWLKKKFVTETNYCITLDRLQAHLELLQQVFDNPKQRADWHELYKLDLDQLAKDEKSHSLDELLEQPKYRYLMLDTAHFDQSFSAQLVATMDDLDEQCDGLLVHSENFQALNLLQERYREQVKCIYIDPPYNTGGDGFPYKDAYQHSSWLSMMSDRIGIGANFLRNDGVFFSSIDENEGPRLNQLLESIFTAGNHLSNFSWVSEGNSDNQGKVKVIHEDVYAYCKNEKHFKSPPVVDPSIDQSSKLFNSQIRNTVVKNGKKNPKSEVIIPEGFPCEVESGVIFKDEVDWPIFNEDIVVEGFKTKNELIAYTGWSSKKQLEDYIDGECQPILDTKGQVVNFAITDTGAIYSIKEREDNNSYVTSVIKGVGTIQSNSSLLDAMGVPYDFYPKPVQMLEYIQSMVSEEESIVLDFFGGSGTTGHACVNLIRNNSVKRKYALFEMGEHFYSVLKPRLQKTCYSDQWEKQAPKENKDGVLRGVSQCFKYIHLETYEDALGNLALIQKADLFGNDSKNDKAREAYLFNYMLDVETRDSASLLNTRQFLDPDRYDELKVRSAAGDETKSVNVDLLETFNYLLGLTVEHIAAPIHFDAELSQGEFGRWQAKVKRNVEGKWWFRTVFGTNRNGQKVLVVWRNLPSVIAGEESGLQYDNAVLDAVLIEKLSIRLTESLDDEIDILYVNGDHNISIPRDRKGQPMEQARLQLIEEAFHRLMFADTESVQ